METTIHSTTSQVWLTPYVKELLILSTLLSIEWSKRYFSFTVLASLNDVKQEVIDRSLVGFSCLFTNKTPNLVCRGSRYVSCILFICYNQLIK